jgi:hypothetical protein
VEGIAQRQSQSVANRRRADGGTHLGGGENGEREGSLTRLTVFIGEGKREREKALGRAPGVGVGRRC